MIGKLATTLLLAGALSGSVEPAAAIEAETVVPGDGPRHLASPDWRDQVIYFAMVDRFDDGDPSNNDQGAGEYDPADPGKYSGGDLAGLERRLDYIQELGATALWITPPVANQWWDAQARFSGYHGYWAENFVEVDRHLGNLDDYRRLARALHGRGMYLVQDIVVNHTGNYFGWPGRHDAADVERDVRVNGAPTQFPFSRNDVRDPAQRAEAIYHWTPSIRDFTDRRQQFDYQLADLDDLDTENPVVRAALRRSYGYWIREVGVDAFRVDTAFYVPPVFFDDFLRSDDKDAPGIERVAAATGRRDFLAFGEGFGIDKPFDDTQARRIDGYLRDGNGRPLLTGMLDFPLYGSLLDVFARGGPAAILGHRIANRQQVHADPHRLATFVDNHDVERFLATGGEAALKQALLAIMTLPGIPVIYAGTEQGYTTQRAALFKDGNGAGGVDHFDRDAPPYRYLQAIIALRRTNPLLSRGGATVIHADKTGAGALAWRMQDGAGQALIVFNSADHEVLMAGVDSGLPAGTRLRSIFAIDGDGADTQVDTAGRLTLRLPARSGQVWLAAGPAALPATAAAGSLRIDPLRPATVTGSLRVAGTATGVGEPRLVIDGDLQRAQIVKPDARGRWQAILPTADYIDPSIAHRLVAWSPATNQVSEAMEFRVQRRWRKVADVVDPAGDDHGPSGNYRYPSDPFWTVHRPLDLRRVRAWTSAGSLRVEIEMRELVAAWNPANGFDHLAITAFLQLPNRPGGSALMPLQNATLPNGMHWHYRLRAGGWSNALFGAEGASAGNEGRAVTPVADLRVNGNRLRFTLPARSIGSPADLRGARLYITTWDYDGGYRALSPKPASFEFGGGDGTREPLWMDASAVIELR